MRIWLWCLLVTACIVLSGCSKKAEEPQKTQPKPSLAADQAEKDEIARKAADEKMQAEAAKAAAGEKRTEAEMRREEQASVERMKRLAEEAEKAAGQAKEAIESVKPKKDEKKEEKPEKKPAET